MKKIVTFSLLINTLLLAGCSQPVPVKKTPTIDTTQQIEQLATLVASGNFLRESCQRSDIPDEPKLIKASFLQAKEKGWLLASFAEKDVVKQAGSLLLALKQDGTPLAEKCAYFNQHLALFIEQARRQ